MPLYLINCQKPLGLNETLELLLESSHENVYKISHLSYFLYSDLDYLDLHPYVTLAEKKVKKGLSLIPLLPNSIDRKSFFLSEEDFPLPKKLEPLLLRHHHFALETLKESE
jgi:hypothetical protein